MLKRALIKRAEEVTEKKIKKAPLIQRTPLTFTMPLSSERLPGAVALDELPNAIENSIQADTPALQPSEDDIKRKSYEMGEARRKRINDKLIQPIIRDASAFQETDPLPSKIFTPLTGYEGKDLSGSSMPRATAYYSPLENYIGVNLNEDLLDRLDLVLKDKAYMSNELADAMHYTAGHEVAHGSKHNPYSISALGKSLGQDPSLVHRVADIANRLLGGGDESSKGIIALKKIRERNEANDKKYGVHDMYFTNPGNPMDELRADAYGYINRLRHNPGSIFRRPLPPTFYLSKVTQPIRDGLLQAWKMNSAINSTTDPQFDKLREEAVGIRDAQLEKARYYVKRMLYPHLGDPNK